MSGCLFTQCGGILLTCYGASDEVHLGKLQQLGMTPSDESKVMAMREFLPKLAENKSK